MDGESGEVIPELASDWSVREDGRVWEFTLKEDLRWSDGEPLNADDVVFTYKQLYLNPDIHTSARHFLLIQGKPPAVSQVNDRTVRFTYPVPFAPFSRVASQPIMPKHVLEPVVEAGEFNSAWDVQTDPDSIVVNGPFRLNDYETSRRVILERNPHYYRSSEKETLPRLKQIVFGIVKNTEIHLLKFLRGEIDVFGVQSRHYQLVKPLEKERDFTVYDDLGPEMGSLFLTFNMNTDTDPETGETHIPRHKLDWFNDRDFRRAVSYGIDRNSIIRIALNGRGQPRYSPVSPANKPFYNDNLEEYPHDEQKAKRILRENGYRDRDDDGIREGPDGHPIAFVLNTNSGNNQRVAISQIVRKDLSNLGFDVTFNQVEFNTLVSKINSDFDWEAVVMGLTGGVDPHFGSNVWKSSGGLHMWHPAQTQPHRPWEAEIDRIFTEAVQETDYQKRRQLYNRWQEIVNKQQPFIYLTTGQQTIGAWNKFTHFNPTPLGGYTHNIEEIGVKP